MTTMILLTPGPCQTSEAVRAASALPDLNHRDPAYPAIVRETKQRLLSVYPATRDWMPYLIGGSGTAAVEAMLTSCIVRGPVLSIENGYYSGRIGEILDVHGIPFERFTLDWEVPWTEDRLEQLEERLSSGTFEAVLATHHETTLGRLNPIEEIARRAKRHGVRVLVDAMSSFGADDLSFDGLDAVVSSANKALHGLPGVSFVLARGALPEVPRRSYYLDLRLYEGDAPPLTPPVPALRAFLEALRENPDGQAVRGRHYRQKHSLLWEGLSRLGFGFATAREETSWTLLAPSLPKGWTFDAWFDANYREGFVLYGCKGEFRQRYFQVSTMGETSCTDMERWLATVERLLGTGPG